MNPSIPRTTKPATTPPLPDLLELIDPFIASPEKEVEPEVWLNVKGVAEHLHLRPRTIYEMVATHKIPFARAGGRLVFSRQKIEHWLQTSHQIESKAAKAATELPHIIAGSHDPLLDWALHHCNSELALMTRGSRDGLTRMTAGQACAALIHLPASDLQSFNLQAVAEAVDGKAWVLLHWARREQGLVCAPGNPRRIKGIPSLKKMSLRVGRRQAGAGTRELFDLMCRQAGLAATPRGITWVDGFNSEDEISQAVGAGEIDCGLAVHSAAKRFQMYFLPLMVESVDLLVDRRSYFEPGIQSLLNFARGKAFADQARRMGGYDLTDFGAVRWNAR